MKDNFSNQAQVYAQFRPNYPERLIEELLKHTPNRQLAWDCGTGNGQIAKYLAAHFEQVIATDISQNQLDKAVQLPNIIYRMERAESSSLASNSVDLLVVAQAVHWFNFEQFYAEVNRVLSTEGIIALVGYALFTTEHPVLNNIVQHFYTNIVGAYWDKERRHIDAKYQTIPFPFESIAFPEMSMCYDWNLAQMVGYFESWSAVQHYKKAHSHNPIKLIINDLEAFFSTTPQVSVCFEIISKIGKIKPNAVRLPS
jgi:ubiquinone/menaquinone biosynthesis C-methylase UbiE